MTVLRVFLLMIVAAAALGPSSRVLGAEQASLEKFFGTYEGTSLRPRSEVQSRDLKVSIRPSGEHGFAIDWQTTLYETGGDQRRKTQSLTFVPQSPGSSFYVAAPDGLDVGLAPTGSPFDGAPFVWASLVGEVLTVNVLTIDQTGGWVMQTYNRALTREGMALTFTRVHDGEVEKRLWGALERLPQ